MTLFLIILFLLAVIVISSCFTVEQQTVAIVERFGKFHRAAQAGLRIKLPLIDRVRYRLSLRIQQLVVPIETKTIDNVFVRIDVAVQYHAIPHRVADAVYKLQEASHQITAYVQDVVRAQVPTQKLDAVFENKEHIAQAVKERLGVAMAEFGFNIANALVTDITPDAKVKTAMNEINAAQRLQEAAKARAEADKILLVKAAEAEAESKKLQGEGIAQQRLAISRGIEESLASLKHVGVPTSEATAMMLATQYLDMLREMATRANMNTILLPHSPSAIGDLSTQLMASLLAAGKMAPTADGERKITARTE
ncbi:SPFH domain-containing protein [Candidatus Uhrbacteria bacterium]|nr:SPFH domain-containing protein [Candidatus Uhrbacteria bacterium]